MLYYGYVDTGLKHSASISRCSRGIIHNRIICGLTVVVLLAQGVRKGGGGGGERRPDTSPLARTVAIMSPVILQARGSYVTLSHPLLHHCGFIFLQNIFHR